MKIRMYGKFPRRIGNFLEEVGGNLGHKVVRRGGGGVLLAMASPANVAKIHFLARLGLFVVLLDPGKEMVEDRSLAEVVRSAGPFIGYSFSPWDCDSAELFFERIEHYIDQIVAGNLTTTRAE
jgi:hypothetical protein